MRDLKEEPREGPEKSKPSPLGYSGGLGWDVASLLILGTSLAVVSRRPARNRRAARCPPLGPP
jgi:hypothetical protein